MSIVKFEMSVKGGKLDSAHTFKVAMDFASVGQDTLVEWASQKRRIDLQAQIRARGEQWARENKDGILEVDALDLLGRAPRVDTSPEGLARAVGVMTEEQKAALRAALGM